MKAAVVPPRICKPFKIQPRHNPKTLPALVLRFSKFLSATKLDVCVRDQSCVLP